MNFKSIYLGLCLFSAFSVDMSAMDFLKKDDDSSCISKTSSTRSMSLKSICYEDMPLNEKYAVILRSFKQDRKTSLQRMEELALTDNYEDAQLYLAECYRMGVNVQRNLQKTKELYSIAYKIHHSPEAANALGLINYADGEFELAKSYYYYAIEHGSLAAKKNLEILLNETMH
jgi:TPR repeat protein